MAVLGRYRVRRKLGEGGMGSVLLADDERGRPVVLKVPLHSNEEVLARMADEARIGMQLQHPHIVRTLDHFVVDGERPVIVIDHIDGMSLKELRDTVGPLPPAMIARVGEQISDALSTLHHLKDIDGRDLQILHRDVTPGNIIVDRSGNACLIDLGIARSVLSTSNKTAVGILRGTFRYLSPDLFHGKPYSWMTDLWALGVTLFEAAVGRKAVEGSEHQVFSGIMHGQLLELRPGEVLHPALRYLFDGLLVADPEQRRFRDPEEVLHAFRVIRGRLGDGEADARFVMATVPGPPIDDVDNTEVGPAPATLDADEVDDFRDAVLEDLDDVRTANISLPPTAGFVATSSAEGAFTEPTFNDSIRARSVPAPVPGVFGDDVEARPTVTVPMVPKPMKLPPLDKA